MFVYNQERDSQLGITGEKLENVQDIAINSTSENEMFELLKIRNPFVNRSLAKNTNLTLKIMHTLLDNYSAYTMNINLAKNTSINQDIKDKLYVIATNENNINSRMKADLDSIFSK